MSDFSDVTFERTPVVGQYFISVIDHEGVHHAFLVTDMTGHRLNRDIVRILNEDDAYLAAQEAAWEQSMMRDPRA